jgi:hypothetical protein
MTFESIEVKFMIIINDDDDRLQSHHHDDSDDHRIQNLVGNYNRGQNGARRHNDSEAVPKSVVQNGSCDNRNLHGNVFDPCCL